MARPANPALPVDILRVTADLVEEKGADNITMREVAQRLGYSATTIYLYYRDKDELLEAAIDRAFEFFEESQDEAERDSCCGIDVLRARSRGYVEWGVRHPNMYRAMFERPQRHSEERSRLRRRSYRAYAATAQRLMEAGELNSSQSPNDIVNLAWATNHGLVSLIISGRMFGPIGETITLDEALARILEMVDTAFDQWVRAWTAPEGEA